MLRIGTFAIIAFGCATEEPPLDIETCDAPVPYRIGRTELPQSNAESRELAYDLDEDGAVDNQLGAVIGVFYQAWKHAFEEHANDHLASDVDWRVSLRRCPDDRVAVAVHRADRAPAYLVTERDRRIVRGSGGVELPLGALFDGLGTGTEPGWIAAELATIELGDPDAPELALGLGVALEVTTGAGIVVEAMTPYLDATADTFYRAQFDADGDGMLTVTEVRESEIMRAVLSPDLDVDRRDGRDAISLALPLIAVPL